MVYRVIHDLSAEGGDVFAIITAPRYSPHIIPWNQDYVPVHKAQLFISLAQNVHFIIKGNNRRPDYSDPGSGMSLWIRR